MAARGRGKGRGGTFSLTQMGMSRGEKIASGFMPPPTYPPLDHFPADLELNESYDEQLRIKDRITSYFRTSKYFLKGDCNNASMLFDPNKPKKISDSANGLTFDWKCFPTELRPRGKRKRESDLQEQPIKKRKLMESSNNAVKILESLEKKEKDNSNIRTDKKNENTQEEEVEEEEEEEMDDTMEDQNDYLEDYFDNGEGYMEEDDTLDEGPSY